MCASMIYASLALRVRCGCSMSMHQVVFIRILYSRIPSITGGKILPICYQGKTKGRIYLRRYSYACLWLLVLPIFMFGWNKMYKIQNIWKIFVLTLVCISHAQISAGMLHVICHLCYVRPAQVMLMLRMLSHTNNSSVYNLV